MDCDTFLVNRWIVNLTLHVSFGIQEMAIILKQLYEGILAPEQYHVTDAVRHSINSLNFDQYYNPYFLPYDFSDLGLFKFCQKKFFINLCNLSIIGKLSTPSIKQLQNRIKLIIKNQDILH